MECMKSALPKDPVTKGGAGPLGVSIITVRWVRIIIFTTAMVLTFITDMTEDLFMPHLPKSQFAPVTVGKKIFQSVEASS